MEALTHQVGHLVREVDGSLLNMLGSVTGAPEECDPLDEGDRRERLEGLLDAFDIPKENRAPKAQRRANELSKEQPRQRGSLRPRCTRLAYRRRDDSILDLTTGRVA